MGRTLGFGFELLVVALAALLLATAIPASFDWRNVYVERTTNLPFWTREVSCAVEATGEPCP